MGEGARDVSAKGGDHKREARRAPEHAARWALLVAGVAVASGYFGVLAARAGWGALRGVWVWALALVGVGACGVAAGGLREAWPRAYGGVMLVAAVALGAMGVWSGGAGLPRSAGGVFLVATLLVTAVGDRLRAARPGAFWALVLMSVVAFATVVVWMGGTVQDVTLFEASVAAAAALAVWGADSLGWSRAALNTSLRVLASRLLSGRREKGDDRAATTAEGAHGAGVVTRREFLASVMALVAGAMALVALPGPTRVPPVARPEFVMSAPEQDAGVADGGPVARCPEGMVLIPGGEFTMGDDRNGPEHRVRLSAYCIDRTEVTVRAYRACVETHAGGCAQPSSGGVITGEACNWGRSGRDLHPINCVDWEQASAYCRWIGGRLPTEAEWEFAARGNDGRRYPWGNEEPGPQLLNACGDECVERHPGWSRMYAGNDGWPETSPVGTYPSGASPFGVFDMSGNVWEWTADRYAGYSDNQGSSIVENPTGPSGPSDITARVNRGGSWLYNVAAGVRAAARNWNAPSLRSGLLGFRCARGTLR